MRFTANGTLDATFGTGGISVITAGIDDAQPSDILVIPGGKLMVAALVRIAPDPSSTALVRLNDDGSLDTTFGTNGVVIAGSGSIRKLVRQPDGKLVAGGSVLTGVGFNSDFAVTRYNPDGSIDAGFGTAGLARIDLATFENILGLTIQPDGAVIAVGQTSPGGSVSQFGIVRLLGDGTLDPAFGSGGRVLTPILGGFDVPLGVAAQPDGRIVAVGEAGPLTTSKIALLRLAADGTFDAGFGAGGIVTTDFSGLGQSVSALQFDPGGRILAAGQATIANAGPISNSTNDDIRPVLLRYLPNGALDPSFGSGGKVIVSVPGIYNGYFLSLLRQPDGKLIAAGGINDFGGGTSFAVARFVESTCGNGIVEPGEQCDDGNTAPGDCCSPTCTFDPVLTACADDGSLCTADRCDGAGTCRHAAAPQTTGCHQSTVAAASRLRVRRDAQLVVWKWLKGSATSLFEFGDAAGSDDFALCAFDESSATPALLFEVTAPAGGLCGSTPCWTQHGLIRYRDPERTPNGMESLDLRGGPAGKAKIAAKGRGANLSLPSLPLPLPVHIQLLAESGGCWEATYGTAGLGRNDAGGFEGRGQ